MKALIEKIKEIYEIDLSSFQITGYLFKKITSASSIAHKKRGKGYHIEFSSLNEDMSFFPLITNTKYINTQISSYKRTYQSKIRLEVIRKNIQYLYSNINERITEDVNLKISEEEIESIKESYAEGPEFTSSFMIGTYNIRGSGQHQGEFGTSKDGKDFLSIRKVVFPNDYILFFKLKGIFKYLVLGIPKVDYETKLISIINELGGNILTPTDKTLVDSVEDIIPMLEEGIKYVRTPRQKHKDYIGNKILFGPPGTGKSNKADEITKGKKVKKVTFHPDYDYLSFVGGYKPVTDEEKNIVYEFRPQVFTKIYVEAWNNLAEHYFLQIEEINRGNCSEIFGNLFQLLDRDSNGYSKYGVDADEELLKYLKGKLVESGKEGIEDGKIKLPNNLSILATMNTSDQSLFPMDSAFKRRWDWEYLPIKYEDKASDFIIELEGIGSYKWLQFLKAINEKIFESTDSQDKQIGNWFLGNMPVVSKETFVNKVVFYLWNDIFKEESNTIFDIGDKKLSYQDFFLREETTNAYLKEIMENNLGLTMIPASSDSGSNS